MTTARTLPVASALRMLRTMRIIRDFEDAAGAALRDGHARGSVHQYTGEEAIATGVCFNLTRADFVSSYHRGHGHAIAKGVSPARMMQELYGRAGGTSGGKGGSMHIADFSCGMLGANGVVPDGVTIAVGAAQAFKMQKRAAIMVAFFGDGALNRGPLFEAFNWAKLFELPVLFVCEDNGYSVTLRTREVTGGPPPIERVKSFGIPVETVNGNDVIEVEAAARRLIADVRAGGGPRYLHAHTYRWQGHLAHDRGLYRDPAEVEAAKRDDCIVNAERWLTRQSVGAAALAEVDEEAKQIIASAVAEALAAPWPDTAQAFTDVQDIGNPARAAAHRWSGSAS